MVSSHRDCIEWPHVWFKCMWPAISLLSSSDSWPPLLLIYSSHFNHVAPYALFRVPLASKPRMQTNRDRACLVCRLPTAVDGAKPPGLYWMTPCMISSACGLPYRFRVLLTHNHLFCWYIHSILTMLHHLHSPGFYWWANLGRGRIELELACTHIAYRSGWCEATQSALNDPVHDSSASVLPFHFWVLPTHGCLVCWCIHSILNPLRHLHYSGLLANKPGTRMNRSRARLVRISPTAMDGLEPPGLHWMTPCMIQVHVANHFASDRVHLFYWYVTPF
jgi:hypothetical protein